MNYSDWISRHAIVFGLDKSTDPDMLAEWAHLFRSEGYSPVELDSATTRMMRTPPKFRSDHLVELLRHVQSFRVVKPFDESNSRGECTACGPTGLVVVPHPQYVVNGDWIPPHPTAAVTCNCALGKWKHTRINEEAERIVNGTRKRQSIMSMERYSGFVPRWKEMMESRQSSRLAFSSATQKTVRLDKMLGAILAGIGKGIK